MAEEKSMSSGETFAAALGYQLAEKDVDLLRWLHAEAVWQRDDARTLADRFGWLLVEARAKTAEALGWFEDQRSSRQAWAEEALRLDDQVRAKSRLSLVDKDDPSQVCYGSDRDMECTSRTFHLGSCPKSPSYMPPAIPANAPCACPTEEQLGRLGSGFTRPQCTVHPDKEGDADDANRRRGVWLTERVWYPMHDHGDGHGQHAHHRDNGGHGSHDGVPLVLREEAMPFVDYSDEGSVLPEGGAQ